MCTERPGTAPQQDYSFQAPAGFERSLGAAVELVCELANHPIDTSTEQGWHSNFERLLTTRGREVLRQMFQDRLDQHAAAEERRKEVVGSDGGSRSYVQRGHTRPLSTVVGEVAVARLAYRAPGKTNLYPTDAELNLPEGRRALSHGLRELAAMESTRGSFEDATSAIRQQTGVEIGKRQVEELAMAAAQDVCSFYERQKPSEPSPDTDVLVLSADGKGVVMRHEGLREATQKAAERNRNKLQTRLSQGEKANRKRMAEVGSVFDVGVVPREAADIISLPDRSGKKESEVDGKKAERRGPQTRGKWVTASVQKGAGEVIQEVFEEAERRDPEHRRPWQGLVDGNQDQITRIETEAKRRHVEIMILIDLIHVLEYLWKAAWCFFPKADPRAEHWVAQMALRILEGNSANVVRAIRARATRAHLIKEQRKGADDCIRYLVRKRLYLNYPLALANGWPIATGVIEGACRHLVLDRMGITGARWGLNGAEAILLLRAVRSNGDFGSYWEYHLQQEHTRVHRARYRNYDDLAA